MTTKEKKSPVCLRILEISAGLFVLILCIAAFWPRVDWGWTTFIAFLTIALIILEIVFIIRIFAKGISGGRRLNLILSVLAILIAVLVLAVSFYGSSSYGFFLTLMYLLALELLFAGIASAARGTVGAKIVGIFGILVGIIVLISFKNRGHPCHFHRPCPVNISRSHLPNKCRRTGYSVVDDLRVGADNFRDNGEMDLIHSFTAESGCWTHKITLK